ncbi:LysR family transcriptional regulator ArgP [Devosia sp. MC1541]|uniref:LysR family transcriptional regulator ArgP n=1 Tax=Devosia sp. MC1541 TaxID=2725264 RepID=UPI00145C842E|nr:LysR family transcriptional regulator ArgP [Devosia sp. MC1541]
MIDYPAAHAVAMVVQTGSFERAAQKLNITQSAVSQRVRQLEERLGAVLIERGTPCIATEKGAWLCRHMELVGSLENDLLTHLPSLGDTAKPLTLDIAVNADSLATWFMPAAAAFAATSSNVLNIIIDDQDFTHDWLRRGRVLAAVTSKAEPIIGCDVIRLGNLRYHATASPQFYQRHFSQGVTAAALAHAPVVTFNQKDQLQRDWLVTNFGTTVSGPTHFIPSSHGFVKASLAHMGWCLNPTALVHDHLASGRLVELIPGATLDVDLYWQVGRLAAKQFAGLTEAVKQAAQIGLVR